MDCIFCRIVEKKTPASVVFEDAHVVAIEDINPQAPVHLLVIPRKHISTTMDIKDGDQALIGHMHQVAGRMAGERGIAGRGFRTVMNCNREAGQTVFHIHLHVLGGRDMGWPPG